MENKESISNNFDAKKAFENFWYHYKWHTISAVAAIFIISMLLLQTCTRQSYDGYILYAGPMEIKKTSQGGDISPYATLLQSLKIVCPDLDNDKNVNVTLQNLFVLNDEEAKELYKINPGQNINTTLVQEDTKILSQTMLYGDYFVCFLSERLFLEYYERYDGALFDDVLPLIGDGECETVNGKGVYLSSLDFYSLPGVCDLPRDTVVCLRALSEVSGKLMGKEGEEAHRRGQLIFSGIVNYEK